MSLWQWFMTVDTDRSGQINSHELQRALAMGNLNFSLALCQQMIRMHDRDGSGTISFDEFQSLHQFLTNTQVGLLWALAQLLAAVGVVLLPWAAQSLRLVALLALWQRARTALGRAADPHSPAQSLASLFSCSLFLVCRMLSTCMTATGAGLSAATRCSRG